MKPDPATWAVLLEDGIDATDVLVVDDQTCNLDAARSLGIMTVAAMGDRSWCREVDAFSRPARLLLADAPAINRHVIGRGWVGDHQVSDRGELVASLFQVLDDGWERRDGIGPVAATIVHEDDRARRYP